MKTYQHLTQAQDNVVHILKQYPNAIVMTSGTLTGGHGISLDLRTVNALKRKGIIVDGRLSNEYK